METLKEKQKEVINKLLELLKDRKSHSLSEIIDYLSISSNYTEELLEWTCFKSNLILEIPKAPENRYELSSDGEIIDIEKLDFSELKIFEEDVKLLQDPLLLYKIKQILDKGIVGEERNKIHIFLIGLTKELGEENAQACYLIGPSSSGKSYILHQTITALEDFYDEKTNPNGKIIWFTRSSAHGLEYYCNKFEDMTGYILFVEEAPGYGNAQTSIRPMFSEKGLKVIIAQQGEKGKIESKEINIRGCPVFFTTSVNPTIERQMSTRVWILQTDDTEEQTKKIKAFVAKQNKYPSANQSNDEKIKLKQTLKLLKRPDKILIPFIEEIDFPTRQVRARRDFAKFKTLIQVSAYLHQYQRSWIELDGKKYLIATFADYYIAQNLVTEGLKALQYGISENVLKLLDVCRAVAEDDKEEITSRRVSENTDYSQTTTSIYLKNLVRAGLLTVEKVGRENHYFLVRKGETTVSLLDIKELASKFNEEKLEDYLSQFTNKPDLTYEEIIGKVYDFLQGLTIKDYNIGNTREDSLSNTNKESNALLKQDKISDSADGTIYNFTKGGDDR